ncbi:F-box only protein 42, partial [Xenoophorus captivus]
TIMSLSPDNEDGYFVAMDTEDEGAETAVLTDKVEAKMGSCCQEGNMDTGAKGKGRTMAELPEEVLEYILSFLSPYQEHKTAALVCKQWYRLIKGVAYQCYHGFLRAVQEGNIQWESRTYPYPGTPITQRFSHSQ